MDSKRGKYICAEFTAVIGGIREKIAAVEFGKTTVSTSATVYSARAVSPLPSYSLYYSDLGKSRR